MLIKNALMHGACSKVTISKKSFDSNNNKTNSLIDLFFEKMASILHFMPMQVYKTKNAVYNACTHRLKFIH